MKCNNKLLSNSVAADTVLCKRTVHHKFCSHIPLITKSIPNTYLGKIISRISLEITLSLSRLLTVYLLKH